jgi:hypothetical protein
VRQRFGLNSGGEVRATSGFGGIQSIGGVIG